jgi:hypothetical protein
MEKQVFFFSGERQGIFKNPVFLAIHFRGKRSSSPLRRNKPTVARSPSRMTLLGVRRPFHSSKNIMSGIARNEKFSPEKRRIIGFINGPPARKSKFITHNWRKPI